MPHKSFPVLPKDVHCNLSLPLHHLTPCCCHHTHVKLVACYINVGVRTPKIQAEVGVTHIQKLYACIFSITKNKVYAHHPNYNFCMQCIYIGVRVNTPHQRSKSEYMHPCKYIHNSEHAYRNNFSYL